MAMVENMKIYTADQNGHLAWQKGGSIVVKFESGKTLELASSPQPLPSEIPEGLYIWGGRMPSPTSTNVLSSPLDITPVAANGIIVSPHDEKTATTTAIMMYIANDDGSLTAIKNKTAVLELCNGKTLEVMEDYAHKGLLIWGGREPNPDLPFEEIKARTESLGLYPVAGNVVHIFPYKLG